jgi:two-component system osmolarity sensor histidine kinase EnvZ
MLRRFMPTSLYARTILIVVLPIFIMQTVITYAFFNRHWDEVTGNLSANVAGEIALITELYQNAVGPLSKEDIRNYSRNRLDMAVRFEPGGVIPEKDKQFFFSVSSVTLDKQLSEKLSQPYWYNTSSYRGYVEIRVQLEDGFLVFIVLRNRVFATNGHLFVLWLIGATCLLVYVSIVFMRNQIRSITRLAAAAEAFGRGKDMPEYKPSGAREVRAAGRAFIAMRQRINRYVTQRTSMLAGVSHDLRTPLTRLKLALAMQPQSDDLKEMQSDVNEMEQMLDEYLSFARDQGQEEPEQFDLRELIEEIAADTERAGNHIEIDMPVSLDVDARRNALKRAISNLVNNSLKHAENVLVSARQADGNVEIAVDDDGPGIDPEQYDQAFKPFARLDEARNQNIAGVGLGLTVVRDVARAHGGEITLSRAPMGGLRAMMRLPV